MGLPTGRETQGNGTPIVVRGEDSSLHGEGAAREVGREPAELAAGRVGIVKSPTYGGMRNARGQSISGTSP